MINIAEIEPKINTTATLEDFLAAFFPNDDEIIHLRFIPPKGERGAVTNDARSRQGLQNLFLRKGLEHENQSRGIYFVVNSGGSDDQSITRYNAFFAEIDDRSIEEQHRLYDTCPLPPSIRVETKKSVHAYWLIDGDATRHEWKDIQARLIAFFNSDRTIRNESRVLRLPGFNHISLDRSGVRQYKAVEIAAFHPERRYTVEQMQRAFPEVPESSRVNTPDGLIEEFPNWKALNAEVRKRILARPNTTTEDGKWIETRGICHDGQGEKGLTFNIATGAYRCKNGCPTRRILQALGLPTAPTAERDAATQGLPQTDLGNAERLVALYGQDLRYCALWRKWLVWDGTRWIIDSTAEVMRRAKTTVRSIYKEAERATSDADSKELAKWAMRSESEKTFNAMVRLAQSEAPLQVLPEQLDADPWLLNVANGTIDLRTGELLPHRREDLITKVVPIDYRPDAEAPIFNQFVGQILAHNSNLIAFLQRAIGYSLTGDTREQVMFILHGNGSNGKSTLINILLSLLGDLAMQTPASTLMVKDNGTIPNDLAALKGARFVAASETDDGKRLSEALVKRLTGGDRISVRFMRGEYFEYVPTYKIFLSTNNKPVIRGADNGIWRRIRLIPFNIQFHDNIPANQHLPQDLRKDLDLPQKLSGELPGILRWAVEGCLVWQRDGLGLPDEVREATAEYRSEMDVLALFLADKCVISAAAKVQSSRLYAIYAQWCDENGEYKLPNKTFKLRMKERGFEPYHGREGNFYYGLGLAADEGSVKGVKAEKHKSIELSPRETNSFFPSQASQLSRKTGMTGPQLLKQPLAIDYDFPLVDEEPLVN
jgi:P4 family phage/plasmid primase-like protien